MAASPRILADHRLQIKQEDGHAAEAAVETF